MRLFAREALLADGWRTDCLLDVDAAGMIRTIETEVAVPADAERAAGPVIAGLPNLHSHAFQRAIAGLTERRGPGEDSFWTWREAMYGFVRRFDPDALEAVAAQVFVEMLKAGFTAVAEFHYVHHDPEGRPYATLTELSDRVIGAAERTGIALTHLPVLYAHGGFGGAPPEPGQRRFVNDPERYARLLAALHAHHGGRPGFRLGIAPHSLRAVTARELALALEALAGIDPDAPVHIHIAEQAREVEQCRAWSGRPPVAWLLEHLEVNARWCLVHATHVEPEEIAGIVASGAVVGLCPTTEANLGDGVFPAREFLERGGRFGVGSDSNVSVSPVEELRLLEYGQRLLRRQRAVLALAPGESVGARLLTGAARGGAQALGLPAGALEPGRRADLVVLDPDAPALAGKTGDAILDALVFAGNVTAVRDVMVGGQWRVREGRHPLEGEILASFRDALRRHTASR